MLLNDAERDVILYTMAEDYLLTFSEFGVTAKILSQYLTPKAEALRPSSLHDVYRRLVLSAQNRNMSTGVISGSIDGIDALAPILHGFEAKDVRQHYGDDNERLLDDIVRRLRPRGQLRRTPRSIWPLFCRSILSGAAFLVQFPSAGDFFAWVDVFDRDDRLRPALPLLLSVELEGFGFPLACDFLKELGYLDFAKPDVHLKAILKGLHFVGDRASDYEVFKTVVRIARHKGVTPYNVDKLLWLVGSGYFYEHLNMGRKGRVPTNRSDFISLAGAALANASSSSPTTR